MMWILLVLLLYTDGHSAHFEHSRWSTIRDCDREAQAVSLHYSNETIRAVITQCSWEASEGLK
jgi:hypothetical protein